MAQQVEPLKKLQLQILSTGSAGAKPITFTHIFGLATEGLSPFEASLDGKKQGDSILLSIPATGFSEFFESCSALLQDLLNLPVLPTVLDLDVKILTIETPDNRELIKAIATAASGGGCGGSCGCGCS